MFDHHSGLSRHAQHLCATDRCLDKPCRDYRYFRCTELFYFDRIVETPRYAAASISNACDDGIAGSRKPRYDIGRRAYRSTVLAEMFEAAHLITLFKQLFCCLDEWSCHVLGVAVASSASNTESAKTLQNYFPSERLFAYNPQPRRWIKLRRTAHHRIQLGD